MRDQGLRGPFLMPENIPSRPILVETVAGVIPMGIETSRSRKIEPQPPVPPAAQPAVALVPGAGGTLPRPSGHAGEAKAGAAGGTPALPDAATQMTGAEMVIR